MRRPDGSTPERSRRDELADHLVRLVSSRLLDSLEILLDETGDLSQRVEAAAPGWAATLLGDDDQAARFLAIRLVATLYPSDRPFDPPSEWWATPLGRVVAWRVGHPAADAVPYSVAGAMLGVTRQGVYDLVQRDKLARHPSGGVTTASVRARIAARLARPNQDLEHERSTRPSQPPTADPTTPTS